LAIILEKGIKIAKITASVVLYDTDLSKVGSLIKSLEKQTYNCELSLVVIDYSINSKYKKIFKSSLFNIQYYSKKNKGFGSGHNYALNATKESDFHVFLNPDIYFEENLFHELSKYLDQNKQCVACSPIIRNVDNSHQLSGRETPSFINLFLRRFASNFIITQTLNVNDLNDFRDSKNYYINSPSISGAFIFIRKNILSLTNGFDERYFMYMEDFDFSRRIKQFGEIHYIKKLSINHHFARGSYYKLNLFYHHLISYLKFKFKFKLFRFHKNQTIKKKKIFVVSTSPFIIDNFFKNQIEKLKENHNVIIFTNFNNFKQINLNYEYLSAVNINISRNINVFNDVVCFLKLFFIFVIFRPAMTIALGPKSGLISGMAAFFSLIKSRVFIFQGLVWSNKKGFYRKFLMFFDFIIAKINNKILSVSLHEKNFLIQNKVVSNKKISVLGNGSICGVRKEFFIKDFQNSLRKKLNLNNVFVFSYIGRLNVDKGVLDLIKAFKNLKLKIKIPIALILVGPDEMDLNNNLNLNDDSIKIFPYQKDLKNFYRLSDCLVLPSYREGLPISILEAFACNLPVIVSDIPPLKSLVSSKRGLTFKVQDIKSLQSKMNKMLKDSYLRSCIQMNAYRYVTKNFNEDDVVNNYVNYFESLLNE
jgi:GT2 family glycosyltransferase